MIGTFLPTMNYFMSSKSSKMKIRCPQCSNRFERIQSTAMPFCSEYCRQIDLGNWLDESYGLPYEGEGAMMRDSHGQDDEGDKDDDAELGE